MVSDDPNSVPGSDDDEAMQELKSLLNERIAAGLGGDISGKNVSEILDDEISKSE